MFQSTNSPTINPVVFIRDGNVFASSLNVAAEFDRQHGHILRDIDTHSRSGVSIPRGFFVETSYLDSTGRSNRSVELSRDGFNLLVMGFTGSKALEYKLGYIAAFNAMEAELRKPTIEIRQPQQPAAAPRISGARLRESRLTADWGLQQLPNLSESSRQLVVTPVLELINVHLPAPALVSRMYDCGAVAGIIGISAHALSRDATYKSLRCAPYGEWTKIRDRTGNDRGNWNWNEMGVSILIAVFTKAPDVDELDDAEHPSIVQFNRN